MLKRILNLFWKCIALTVIAAAAGTVLLTLVFLLPVNTENRDASYTILDKEGWNPIVPVLSQEFDTYFHSYQPGVLSGSTDRIMMYTSMDTNEGNPLIRAMRMHNEYMGEDYPRYWQGYVCILRPLMLLFDYGELRIVNSILQMLLIFALAFLVWKKTGNIWHLLILFSSYILLMPMALALALQYTWVFYIAVCSCLVLLHKQRYFEQKSRYIYLFLITGIATSFFDMLTYPLFTWGFPLLWWLIVSSPALPEAYTVKTGLKRVTFSALSWVFGYALMWSLKWIIGSIVLGENLIQNALEQILTRSALSEGASLAERFHSCYTNWKHYEYKIYMIILIAWLLLWIVQSIRYGFRSNKNTCACLLAGFSSIVWYVALSNHTATHHLFTYRIYNVSILAFLAILSGSISAYKKESGVSLRTPKIWLPRVAAWCLIAILAFGISRTAREPLTVLNGYCPPGYYEIPSGTALEMDFSPSFSEIQSFSFGMHSESTAGTYEISLSLGDSEIEHLSVPIAEVENDYYTFNVNWNLEEETYRLRMEADGNNAAVYAEITEPDSVPLTELTSTTIGDTAFGGQAILGLTYNAPPISRSTRIFQFFTWMGILAACLTAGKELAKSFAGSQGKL